MASKETFEVRKPQRKAAPKVDGEGHFKEIPRLKRIRGQVDGIQRMIEEKRYCVEILQQIKAARSALLALENSVLTTHLESCVSEAFNTQDGNKAAKKIQEIKEFLSR